jgi:hypothetical protein
MRPRPWRLTRLRLSGLVEQVTRWIDWGELPSDRIEARRIARKAKSFTMIDRELYKRIPSGILQQCIPILEGWERIRDIHAGVCGHHAATRTLVGNVFRQGFYLPTMVATPARSCTLAKGASSTLARRISQPTPSKPSPSHALSPYGRWTSLGLCARYPGASRTCRL